MLTCAFLFACTGFLIGCGGKTEAPCPSCDCEKKAEVKKEGKSGCCANKDKTKKCDCYLCECEQGKDCVCTKKRCDKNECTCNKSKKEEPKCDCTYCSCSEGGDCTCNEKKCKDKGCKCNKWKKPEPKKD